MNPERKASVEGQQIKDAALDCFSVVLYQHECEDQRLATFSCRELQVLQLSPEMKHTGLN